MKTEGKIFKKLKFRRLNIWIGEVPEKRIENIEENSRKIAKTKGYEFPNWKRYNEYPAKMMKIGLNKDIHILVKFLNTGDINIRP